MPFEKSAVSLPQMNVRRMWRHSDHECRLSDADCKYVLCERMTYVHTCVCARAKAIKGRYHALRKHRSERKFLE
jgi:hypothetical protein